MASAMVASSETEAVACRGGRDGPEHPAWGHPTTKFSSKSVGKCLKIREKRDGPRHPG